MTIKHGALADYFQGIGFKRLKPVEIDPNVSNEHEFNGISKFKELFGLERQNFPVRIIYLCDSEEDILEDSTHFTWYDAREKHASRTEHRLYYKSSTCIEKAAAEDLMVICLNKARSESEPKTLTVFVAKHGDTVEHQLAWLFGIQLESVTDRAAVQHESEKTVDFFTGLILERVGINIATFDESLIDKLLGRFSSGFPSTYEFSAFARELCPEVSVREAIDSAIIAWIETEESAFRTFEHYFVKERIEKGFATVDEFINFSLSVHNRRKSRAGFALENHLKFAFETLGIHHSFNKVTENKSRPDFIFPGIAQYHDLDFPVASLTMLGVKTTCKDRWRQVLSEAHRIPNKHLLTLEPSISVSQTDEMRSSNLQLVVPQGIFSSYTPSQQSWLMEIHDFIDHLKTKEKHECKD